MAYGIISSGKRKGSRQLSQKSPYPLQDHSQGGHIKNDLLGSSLPPHSTQFLENPPSVENAATMRKYKVGDRRQAKLSGGRILEATIKAVVETTEGVRLQVSFGEETALIYPWQIVLSDA